MKTFCPCCHNEMQVQIVGSNGIYYGCQEHGALLSKSFLSRFQGTQNLIKILFAASSPNDWVEWRELNCCFCRERFKRVSIPGSQGTIVDVCLRCQYVWFDKGEIEKALTSQLQPQEENAYPNQGKPERIIFPSQQIPFFRWYRSMRSTRSIPNPYYLGDDARYGFFSNISNIHPMNLFGMPGFSSDKPTYRDSVLAWPLVLTSALGTFLLFKKPTRLFDWIYNPAEPWKHLGLNHFSTLFLYSGWWTWLASSYFLFHFASAIEDELGPKETLILFFFSGIMGNLALHLPNSGLTGFGSASAVFGMGIYYALAFPNNRITYTNPQAMRYGLILNMKPLYFFLLALVPQILLLFYQSETKLPHQGFWAQMGGAIGGLLYFGFRRKK